MSLFWGILSHFGSGAGMAGFVEEIGQEKYGESFVSFLKQVKHGEQLEHFGKVLHCGTWNCFT